MLPGDRHEITGSVVMVGSAAVVPHRCMSGIRANHHGAPFRLSELAPDDGSVKEVWCLCLAFR